MVVQAAGGHVDRMLQKAVAAGDATQAKQAGEYAVTWMRRMAALLHLRPDRRLESWTEAARSWARSDDQAAYYDENARRLITTWGWPELSDYASRAWSGLTRDYYAARWSAWLDARRSGRGFSLDIWQQTWLSSPYRASPPMQISDLFSESKKLLEECRQQTGTA
jgi:alpha-N-acetylglucosaminidase